MTLTIIHPNASRGAGREGTNGLVTIFRDSGADRADVRWTRPPGSFNAAYLSLHVAENPQPWAEARPSLQEPFTTV